MTTRGRMPRPGVNILSAYAYLALASDPIDADLAGIFKRLWRPDLSYLADALKFDLDGMGGKFQCMFTQGRLELMRELANADVEASDNPTGFWSKPWGALAIHRRDHWCVSIKGSSQYVWDFEMHPKTWAAVEENVFARYWSYGTLQILANGEPVNTIDSGWDVNTGWDWCRWPGATTPHMTLDELYDPETTWAPRFFSAATFVGAVELCGHDGMFALKLHEHFYDPSFRAYKTYTCFDNEIICLGSNIETLDDSHPIETTLYQCLQSSDDMPIWINGDRIDAFPLEFTGTQGESLTIMDPYGNGYCIPDGGNVHVHRQEQGSRDGWNQGETRGSYSTCWRDHGVAPKSKGGPEEQYEFVSLVQTTPDDLEDYRSQPSYEVLCKDHRAHIVRHDRKRTYAYALFETDWLIPHGVVRKTDTPVLIMIRDTDDGIYMSVTDPDLRLPKRRNMAYLDKVANETPARPSTVCIELAGRWSLSDELPGVDIRHIGDEYTQLKISCRHGLTVEMALFLTNN